MLDNRKIGELPEITGKMVKVRLTSWFTHIPVSSGELVAAKRIPFDFRASFVWCFMTAGFSTQSTSSWKAGVGIGPEIASSTWVSTELNLAPEYSASYVL